MSGTHDADGDDFWGDVPDWSLDEPRRRGRSSRADRRASTDRSALPRTTGAWTTRLRSALGLDTDTDTDTTRSHGMARPSLDDHATGDDDLVDHQRAERTADVGVDLTDDFAPVDQRHHHDDPPRGGVDPLLARFGAAAVVLTLMVPLAVNLVGDDPLDQIAGEALESGAAPTDDTGQSVPTLDAAAPAESVTTATEPAFLDPADLPPAVPVNDVSDELDSENGAQPQPGADDGAAPEAGADTVTVSRGNAGDPASNGIDESVDADDPADRLRLDCPIEYTVRSGEYWIGLADGAGVDLAELLDVNAATVDTPLYPGTDICLPAGATTPPAPTVAPTTVATTSPPTTTAPSATTTTTTTTTTTVPPEPPPGPDEIVEIIRAVWPDDLEDRALEIAYRESRYVPTAKNFCCYGLFQIYWSVHQGWLADLGVTSAEQLYDPEINARAALALYERAGGWGPWQL